VERLTEEAIAALRGMEDTDFLVTLAKSLARRWK
jgi:hypothetical protein